MKYLLFASLLLLAPAARAQTTPAPAGPVIYRYCALVVDDYLFNGSNRMTLHYGRLDAKQPADAVLEVADKQISKTRNIIFALNYLSDLGWECFNVTTVPSTTSTGRISSETRYLFRRPKP